MVEATVSGNAYVTSPLRADDRRFDELSYMANYKAKNPSCPGNRPVISFSTKRNLSVTGRWATGLRTGDNG
jgi:hypothetical protein